MPSLTEERRSFPRITLSVPVIVQNTFKAKIIDLSEAGISIETPTLIDMTKSKRLAFTLNGRDIEAAFDIKWHHQVNTLNEYNQPRTIHKYGLIFEDISNQKLEILLDHPFELKNLSPRFIKLSKKLRNHLKVIKMDFDNYDHFFHENTDVANYITARKKKYFAIINRELKGMWGILKKLDLGKYREHQNYLRFLLSRYIVPAEINYHIYHQPFGYPGDFKVMNYIYDYCNNSYVGKSAFEMFLNNYTCNLPVAHSNIARKEYFKRKLLETTHHHSEAQIMSIGGGPAREVLELLRERRFVNHFHFTYLDIEKRAIEYVQNEIGQIPRAEEYISINYILTDAIRLIKQRDLKNSQTLYNFIYVSGLMDYFNDHLCALIVNKLCDLLKSQGRMIVCNINRNGAYHRSYYETLGGWKMYHRSGKEMLSWNRQSNLAFSQKIIKVKNCKNYLFLEISKK